MSRFIPEKPPEGLSNVGLYIFYACQMEMYRRSLGIEGKPAVEQSVQRIGLLAWLKIWWLAQFANR